MPSVASPTHQEKARIIRSLLAKYEQSEDLMRIGAYKAGSDHDLDRAIRAMPAVRGFVEQKSSEQVSLEKTIERLCAMEC